MAHINRIAKKTIKRTDFQLEQDLWNSYRELHRAKGIDVNDFLADWAGKQAEQLASLGVKTDFDALCTDGCALQVLALTIALLRFAPFLQDFWIQIVGNQRRREKVIRTFEAAASTIEDVFGELIQAENCLRPGALGSVDPPSRIVGQLRLYCRVLSFAETLSTETETRSLQQVVRFILSSYVRRASGRFHDNQVSALIAAVEKRSNYDEVAHRMWRKRNYPRLSKHFAKATEFLFALGTVIARTT